MPTSVRHAFERGGREFESLRARHLQEERRAGQGT